RHALRDRRTSIARQSLLRSLDLRWSGPVPKLRDPLRFGAMVTTEESACFFQAVTDDSDAAGSAYRRQGMYRTFEAVEYVLLTVFRDLESFVVIVATCLACCHGCDLSH